jgi:hypothetical protein
MLYSNQRLDVGFATLVHTKLSKGQVSLHKPTGEVDPDGI